MAVEIDPLELKVLYDGVLPPDSKGRLADNPQAALEWFSGELPPRAWPTLILAQDKEAKTHTWHKVCADWPYMDFFYQGRKSFIDERISGLHGRNLTSLEAFCVELTDKRRFKHYFLSDEPLDYRDFTLITIE
ncbi:MAG: hypothetical protein ABIH34_01885 [Nanoarchaeota archaeon]